MSKIEHKPGYIYVYPCIQGNLKNLSKIGVTDDFKERMAQHVRTPYQGFTCFLNFSNRKPIATAFRVKYMDVADDLVKNYFSKDYQIAARIEVYNINYNVAIQELYNLLYDNNEYIDLIEDGVTDYSFLVLKDEVKVDTRKEIFESLRDKILSKYNGNLPDELMLLLRDKEEYKDHCSSHYKTGNFVEFRDGYILDICVSKPSRFLLLNKLQELLERK